MAKLDREIERANVSLAVVYFSHTFFVAIPSLFMKEEDYPLFMESVKPGKIINFQKMAK